MSLYGDDGMALIGAIKDGLLYSVVIKWVSMGHNISILIGAIKTVCYIA